MIPVRFYSVTAILLVAAIVLFIAAALVALGTFEGNWEALTAIGLACAVAAPLPWRG